MTTPRHGRTYGIPAADLHRHITNYYETDNPIPIVYGEQRVKACIIWEGKIQVNPYKYDARISGMSRGGTYSPWAISQFSASLWLGICFGKVNLLAVYLNNLKYYSGSSGNTLSKWNAFEQLFNDGTQDIYPGNDGGITTALQDSSGNNIVIYGIKGVSHFWGSKSIQYADGKIPDIDLLVKKTLNSILQNPDIYSINNIYLGNNPANVIYDLLTNNLYGVGVSVMNTRCMLVVGTLITLAGLNGCITNVENDIQNTQELSQAVTKQDFIKIVNGNGIYTAITKNQIFKSADGITWEYVSNINLGGIDPFMVFRDIAYGNGKFVVLMATYNNSFIRYTYTSDNWASQTTAQTTTTGSGYVKIFYVGTKWIAISGDGYCIKSINELSSWVGENHFANILLSENYNTISGCIQGSYLVLHYNGIDNLSANKAYICLTNNGTTWNNNEFSILRINCNNITYGNSTFVLIGNNGFIATSTSPDGSWTVRSSGTTLDLHSVIYDTNTSKFIVSGDGGILLSSADGVTWARSNITIKGQLGIDVESFENASDVFSNSTAQAAGRNYGINCTLDKSKTALQHIEAICEATDCILCMNPTTGLLTITAVNPFDASVPELTLLDEDIKGLQITNQNIKDLGNIFTGAFVDPALQYKNNAIKIKNEALIAETGIDKIENVDLSYFTNIDTASYRLHEIMKISSIPAYTISGTISQNNIGLYPGKLFNLNSAEYNVNGVFRITKMTVSKYDTADIDIEAIQALERSIDTKYTSISAAYGFTSGYTIPNDAEVVYVHTNGRTFPAKTSANLSIQNAVVMWENGLGFSGILEYGRDFILRVKDSSTTSLTNPIGTTFNQICLTDSWLNVYGASFNTGIDTGTEEPVSETETLSLRVWNKDAA